MWALVKFAPSDQMRTVLNMMEERYREKFLKKHLQGPWFERCYSVPHLGRCPQCEDKSVLDYIWDIDATQVDTDQLKRNYGGTVIYRHKSMIACGNCWVKIRETQPEPTEHGFMGKYNN